MRNVVARGRRRRVSGWRDVTVRVVREARQDRIALVSAGVAFYSLLALFPGMIALVSILGLFLHGAVTEIPKQVGRLSVLPVEVRRQLAEQLGHLATTSPGKLSLGVAAGIVVALWSTSNGMRHLIDGINVAYEEQESRRFLQLRGLSLLLTLGAIVVAMVALGVIIALPLVARRLPLPAAVALNALRWVLLGALVVGALAVLYRYGPDRERPRGGWASWGSLAATALWVVGSMVFSVYASQFGHFNKTYGSLGAVVVLLFWLFLSSFAVLVGAELDAELELRARRGAGTASPPAPHPSGTGP